MVFTYIDQFLVEKPFTDKIASRGENELTHPLLEQGWRNRRMWNSSHNRSSNEGNFYCPGPYGLLLGSMLFDQVQQDLTVGIGFVN